MNGLVASVRSVRMSFHLAYALILDCIYPLLRRESQGDRMQKWALKLLDILNVQLHSSGQQLQPHRVGRLIVANHISWLDVFVINATTPARFVAKSEVRRWPFFGWLVQRAGTVFIRREVKRDTALVNQCLARDLLDGGDIALFPQGTSTDGSQPVRFHSSMLQCAIDAGAVVWPVAICYHDGQGRRLSELGFAGEMTFIHSLWKTMCMPRIEASSIYLPGIASAEMSRREIAAVAQDAVNRVLKT